MKSHFVSGYILKKFLSVFLIVSFFMAPLAPIFAQEAVLDNPAPISTESVSPVVPDILPGPDTLNTTPNETVPDTSPQIDTTPMDMPTDVVADPKDEKPTEEVPVDEVPVEEEPEMMMSMMGGTGGFLGDTRDLPNIGFPSVDKASGGLSYSYPLTLPPGRNGLDPKLALEYSSQENDQGNLFGYGWNINIPYIKRINKTGIEKLYTENYFYSSLSGELVLVSGTTYAPKVEDGRFLTYTFDGTYWTVKSKDGSVYKFGYNVGARQNNSGDTKTFKWMLEEERDTNNNYIKYEYYKNGGQIYPDTITYTGNASTDGIFTVVFSRASRNDAVTQDFGVFDVTTSYRISEIQAKINGTWARKYTLGYSNGDNSQRSLLTSITEAGQDESSNTTTLAPIEFTYQVATTSSTDFVTDSAWSTAPSSTVNTLTKYGTLVADVNDDGLPDVMESWRSSGNNQWYKGTYLNDGDGTWTQDTNLTPPIEFANNSPITEKGVRAADINADGLADIIQSYSGLSNVYINQGTSWYLDNTNWVPPCTFVSYTYGDVGCRLVDINGDDLPDFISAVGDSTGNAPITTSVYLNTGNGWSSSSSWSIPVDLRFGAMLVDYNGDGLVDILKGYKNPDANPAVYIQEAYKNNGDKTWSSDSAYTPPVYFAVQTSGSSLPVGTGIQIADINGDGLVDILRGTETTDGAHLNKGSGWYFTTNWDFGHGSVPMTSDTPTRYGDFDGDGMIDTYESDGTGGATMQKNQNVKADLMKTLKNQYGGVTTITYKGSPKYTSGGSLLNPDLPFVLMTVYQTSTDSGFGNSNIVNTYSYEGGDYYYNTITDRRFSGFNKISVSDGTTKTTTFYHQGNTTDSSNGEYSDHSSKIGKVYRVETTDTSGNVYKKVVNKWDKYNQGTGRDFVKPVRSTVLTYDGDSDHKDIAEEYTYDNTYGNLTDKIMWGDVTGSNDGSFTDTGSDKYTESISYISNTTDYIVGLPYQDTVVDQSSNKVRESKTYYDTQSLGTVTDGNITKVERWKSGSTYVNTQKAYNTTYGIPTSSTDERGKTTTYSYDSYNLYPATVTNPLSQAVSYTYDYSLGKPKQFTDQNSFVYQTVYDGLDRVKEEKVPDLSSPYSALTKNAYTYTDTSGSIAVQKTVYLDGSNTALSYTYFDKLNRPIQTRVENESDYNVKDFLYNAAGLLQKESLPYSSSGTAITTATSTASLYDNFTYDPLQRISTQVNNVGTTSYAYDDWKTSITDPNGKLKHYYKDAYDNLIRVDETNSGSTYTTYYEWNGNKLLTKITDALSNIRNFTYDGLGRRLTAEDLHASADGTFGTWTYTYDDAGNLTQSVNPNSQTVNYTYNDINQVLTEDYTGDTGTEITYTYGGCTNGTGKLCNVDMLSGADTDYTYNSNGSIASEVKTISSTGYTTSYTYDRQGNILEITNPDSSKVKYNFNTAGTIETIQRKESGDASYTNVITDMDYGPHGKNTYREFLNGINTTNTFDATKLYRLTRINTINPNDTSSGSPTTTYFYSDQYGDGNVEKYSTSWDTAHDATTGYPDASSNITYVRTGKHSNNYYVTRALLPFDTSSLPNNAYVTQANLRIYVTDKRDIDNDGNDFITIVNTTQENVNEVNEGDFNEFGSTNNPTEGIDTGERKDITNISEYDYLTFNLNNTGKSWVSKTGYTKLGFREGHDVLDDVPSSPDNDNDWNQIEFRASEYSDDTYDPKLEVTYTIPVATDFQDINYTYDANGNITQIVDSSDTNASKTVAYTYDDLNRMLTATATGVASGQSTYTHTYAYNAIGNMTSGPLGTYTYSGSGYYNPHAVTSIGSTNYTYDNAGNMLTETSGLSNTWNYKNQLTQAVKGGVTSTYTYDYTGQRVKLGNGTITTVYPSMYYSTDGTTKTKSVYFNSTLVATIETAGSTTTPYYIHTDHLNSINVVSDNTGAKVELLDYYPYGSTRISSGSYTNQKQYIGQYYDTNTLLNYLNARYYHNINGQFISQDPMFWTLPQELLLDPQQQNSYSYATNNPIINSDPSGLISKSDFSPASIANRIDNIINSYFGNSQNQNSQIVSPVQTKQSTNVSQLTDNKNGSVDYGQYNVTSTTLRNRLDKFANDTNQNIIVTSGDRSSERNKAVGGANASRHLNGDAADIKVNGVSNEQLAYMANKSELFNTTIYYPVVELPRALSPHVHVDLNPAHNNSLLIYSPFIKNGSIVNYYKPLINPLIRSNQ